MGFHQTKQKSLLTDNTRGTTMDDYFSNKVCKIENCGHRKGHATSSKHYGASWNLFGICPCCAKETFPTGYHPERGLPNYFYSIGNVCKKRIEDELQAAADKERRNKASQLDQQ